MKQPVGCAVVSLGLLLSGCGDSHPHGLSGQAEDQKAGEAVAGYTAPAVAEADIPLLTHQVVDRKRYDTPTKTQVELHVVVSGLLTEAGLKQLLHKLDEEQSATEGFAYFAGKRAHTGIYLYDPQQYSESHRGDWVAKLSRPGARAYIDTEVNTVLIEQLNAKREGGPNLSEAKRKEVFRAASLAEVRADAEAQRLYPVPDHLKPGYSKVAAIEQVRKQVEVRGALRQEYRAEVAKTYGITLAELHGICVEALKKNWLRP